eukprot:GHVU01074698.1.p1 GENE.GHVU01074698.1~~GHVU01074698.1.p1  ORF type:complete len:233 (-),score=36.13 GHVU01074698.1:440-1138(-)
MNWDLLQSSCDTWRLFGDITNDTSTIEILMDNYAAAQDTIVERFRYGRYTDMDSLEIGNQLSPGWSRIHMSVWALMGSPLILGHDIKNADPYALEILMNERVIAIDQDRSPPGKRLAVVPDEPRVVQDRRTGQLFTVPTHWGSFWVRELSGGRWAAAIVNHSPEKELRVEELREPIESLLEAVGNRMAASDQWASEENAELVVDDEFIRSHKIPPEDCLLLVFSDDDIAIEK